MPRGLDHFRACSGPLESAPYLQPAAAGLPRRHRLWRARQQFCQEAHATDSSPKDYANGNWFVQEAYPCFLFLRVQRETKPDGSRTRGIAKTDPRGRVGVCMEFGGGGWLRARLI
jgi:hypothetical protein